MELIKNIKKRDNLIVPFDKEKIISAIMKAFQAVGEGLLQDAINITEKVINELVKSLDETKIPEVEQIQDIVEAQLIFGGFAKVAKAYILYMQKRMEIREKKVQVVSLKVKELVAESKKYFHNSLAEFIFYRTYARWIDAESRRETWIESVER